MPRLRFRLGETIQNMTDPGGPDSTVAYQRQSRTPMVIGGAKDIQSGAPMRMAALLNDSYTASGAEHWSPTVTAPSGTYHDPGALETYYPPAVDKSIQSKLPPDQAAQVRDEFNRNANEKGMIRIGLSRDPREREAQFETRNPRTGRTIMNDVMHHEGVHAAMRDVQHSPQVPQKGGFPNAMRTMGYASHEFPAYAATNSPLEFNPQDRENYLQDMITFLNQQDKTGTLARKYQEMWQK